MYECESWTINKAEHQRIDAFELWCWRRFLRVLWAAKIQSVHRKGNQFWIFIGRTCWSWSSNTLATWCEKLTHWKTPWCWERLKVEGEGDDRGWDAWMASPTRWTWVWVNSGSWWWIGKPGVLHIVHEVAESRTQLRDWTEPNWIIDRSVSLGMDDEGVWV